MLCFYFCLSQRKTSAIREIWECYRNERATDSRWGSVSSFRLFKTETTFEDPLKIYKYNKGMKLTSKYGYNSY